MSVWRQILARLAGQPETSSSEHKFVPIGTACGTIRFKCHGCGAESLDMDMPPHAAVEHSWWTTVSLDCLEAEAQIRALRDPPV